MNVNALAGMALAGAARRGKLDSVKCEKDQIVAIEAELNELKVAMDNTSEHLPRYSEREEEAADVIIATLTYLAMKGTDIDRLLTDKIMFNLKRKA